MASWIVRSSAQYPKGTIHPGHVLRNAAISAWFLCEHEGQNAPKTLGCEIEDQDQLIRFCSTYGGATWPTAVQIDSAEPVPDGFFRIIVKGPGSDVTTDIVPRDVQQMWGNQWVCDEMRKVFKMVNPSS